MKINTTIIKETLFELFCVYFIFVIILSFFDYTHWNGITEEDDKNIVKRVFNRFYFITSTISSVGYGDITPRTYATKSIVSVLHVLVTINIVKLIGKF